MKNFTVEEINLMCCFNTSSRKQLEAMTDAEFEELYIMPDGMMDD